MSYSSIRISGGSLTSLSEAMETVCAFLNSDSGGTVLIGVKNDGKIVGQEINDNHSRDLATELKRIEPSTKVNVKFVAVDDKNEIHGCATATFLNYPNSRVGYITTIGGHLIANKDTFKELCEILKGKGATKVQGMGRPSIVRLWKRFGFEPMSTLVEFKL